MLSRSSRKGSNPLGDAPKSLSSFSKKIKKGIDKQPFQCYNKDTKTGTEKETTTMTKNHNPEVQKMLIKEYHSLAYTTNYGFCVKTGGKVTAVIVENVDCEMLEQITYCEPQAESHGGYYGLRMLNSKATMNYLLDRASKTFEIGTYAEFEDGFAEYRANGNKGNRGDYFEDLFAEMVKGSKPESRTACFTDCGDVIANGVHYQCKLYNATFTTTQTIKKTLERMAKVA